MKNTTNDSRFEKFSSRELTPDEKDLIIRYLLNQDVAEASYDDIAEELEKSSILCAIDLPGGNTYITQVFFVPDENRLELVSDTYWITNEGVLYGDDMDFVELEPQE